MAGTTRQNAYDTKEELCVSKVGGTKDKTLLPPNFPQSNDLKI